MSNLVNKETTVLLRELLDAMDFTVSVADVQNERVFMCRTLHLRELREVQDESGNRYTVTDFLNNEWIDLEAIDGAPIPFEGETVICPPLTYLYGTPSSTDDDYQQINVESGQKTPLVWYWWDLGRDNWFGRKSSLDVQFRPRLVFLDETDEYDWSNEEHFTNSIQPMFNLTELFIETVNSNRIYKTLEDFDRLKRARFGRYVDPQGNDALIIDEYLSGVELQPTLIKYKQYSCKNC
jgi:hypothetical protein